MKTKTVVEWVSGESPETESLKLISITEGDGRKSTSIGFMRDGSWYQYDGTLPVAASGSIVTAWAPLPVFDGEVEPLHKQAGKSFGEAIEAMRTGNRVRRFHWLLGVSVWLMPEAEVKAEWCREPHLKALAERKGGSVYALAAFRRVNAHGHVTTGWTPSAADMLSNDWVILD